MGSREVIWGPPGTGKTTTLKGLIADAVGLGVDPGRILVGSLTKTAAREIASRLATTVEVEHVGTVHSLARRALVAAGIEPVMIYKPEYISEFNKFYGRKLPLNLGRSLFDPDAATYDLVLLGDMDRRLALGQPITQWPLNVRRLHEQWESYKKFRTVFDFTDLIKVAIEHVPRHPLEPQLIVIDEAQDLSSVELDLIELWAETADRTILAGDDQQALYEWRGAAVDRFMEFAPKENQTVLERTYRMDYNVHTNAVLWGLKIKNKVLKSYQANRDGGVVRRVEERHLPRLIPDLLDQYDSVMLLATCGYMLKKHLLWIKEQGIPYHNPYRTAAEGKTWNPLNNEAAKMWRSFLRPSMMGGPRWTWQEVAKMAKCCPVGAVETDAYARKLILARATDTSRFDNTQQLLTPGFIKAAAEGNCDWLFEHMLPANRLPSRGRAVTIHGYMKRLGTRLFNPPRLIVGTVHSVKGGEADAVVMLPTISPSAARSMRMNSAGHDSVMRTMYVGLSRARNYIAMVHSRDRSVAWR